MLLKPVNGVRIADRVVVITDATHGRRESQQENLSGGKFNPASGLDFEAPPRHPKAKRACVPKSDLRINNA